MPVLGGARHKHETLEVGIVSELLVAVAELSDRDRPPVFIDFEAVRVEFELDGRDVGARMCAIQRWAMRS